LCIEHRRLDVIGPGREQVLAIGILFVVETPTTDHDLELRTLRTQALTEMPRLAQASWGHRPDAEKRGVVLVLRQLVRERHQLASGRPTNPAQDREREGDSHEGRRPPTQPSPLDPGHGLPAPLFRGHARLIALGPLGRLRRP
jgi:hypothetical protein